MSEADAYVRELQAYQAQEAATRLEHEHRRSTWLASLCSTCAHCQTPRAYTGLEQLQDGSRTSVALLGEAWSMSNVDVHVYQCAYCGSMELFRDGGPIDHPLAGNRPAEQG